MEPSFEGDTELPQWKKVVGMGAGGVQELREEVVQGCSARGEKARARWPEFHPTVPGGWGARTMAHFWGTSKGSLWELWGGGPQAMADPTGR